MSDLSKNTEQQYLLNGTVYNAPEGWEDIEIEANYINDNIQPSLTIDEYKFPLEAKKAIVEWFESGLNGGVGCFEGMPFKLLLTNNNNLQVSMDSFLDFTNDYQDFLEDGRVSVNIIKEDGIDEFYSKLGTLTYGYLEDIGDIVDADYTRVDYVVEKKFNMFEILMSTVVLYLMIKALAESIKDTSDSIATASGIFAAGFTGSLGSAIYLVAVAIVNVIYTAILLLVVIDLASTLIQTLVSPRRTHKALLLKKALSVVCSHLGYGLVAPSSEFTDVHYLPSNPRLDDKTAFGFISVSNGTPSGIPNVVDYGYNCQEMFELAKNLISGKIAIIGGNVHIRPKNDPFWEQVSSWQLPSKLIEVKRFNLDEIRGVKIKSFAYDLNDEWTIDNYTGTSVEVKTTQIQEQNKKAVLIKGLEETNYNVALGNRKGSLNAIEKLIKEVASVIDGFTGFLGNGTTFASDIEDRVGVLKQSNNWHTVPKLLYLKNSKLPANHRDALNAKKLYTKYGVEDSFVRNSWRNQKTVYKDIEIPFGIEDFNQLSTNPYFNFRGDVAKITNFVWTTGQDVAKISFWIRKPYTFNLKEIVKEP